MSRETIQILDDADEIEFFGTQYPVGSKERARLYYFAEILRREYKMTDAEKLDLTLKTLERAGPCTKTELIERLDFSRDECRRIVEGGIHSGSIQTIEEPTNGRPRILLMIPS
ncbi:MAG: hypothetical protein KF855_17210 [Acidobacteria bacterium]|nr:hypothetical protein [Acidobacteriota bacterium]